MIVIFHIEIKEWKEGGLCYMDISSLITVLSFGLTCFGIGYSFGRDNSNAQK